MDCEAKGEGDAYADTILFFGCRHKDADFIYEDELLGWARSGTLTALDPATVWVASTDADSRRLR